jgi:hypothetical protein
MKAGAGVILALVLVMGSVAGELAACATTDTQSAKITAIRTLIDAEAAFNAAVTSERAAERSGFLTDANATKADALIDQAYSALKVARVAENAGVNPDVSSITALIAQIVALTPQGAK